MQLDSEHDTILKEGILLPWYGGSREKRSHPPPLPSGFFAHTCCGMDIDIGFLTLFIPNYTVLLRHM